MKVSVAPTTVARSSISRHASYMDCGGTPWQHQWWPFGNAAPRRDAAWLAAQFCQQGVQVGGARWADWLQLWLQDGLAVIGWMGGVAEWL
jgi:hypothetical protein